MSTTQSLSVSAKNGQFAITTMLTKTYFGKEVLSRNAERLSKQI
jgi:hypothetical protein